MREREQTDRKGEGEEGNSVALHLDPEQRQDVHGGAINGALLRVMKSFFYSLQGRQTCSWESAAWRNSGAQDRLHSKIYTYHPRESKSSPEYRSDSFARGGRFHRAIHPGTPLEPLVIVLVSTPARGNATSREAVESWTA